MSKEQDNTSIYSIRVLHWQRANVCPTDRSRTCVGQRWTKPCRFATLLCLPEVFDDRRIRSELHHDSELVNSSAQCCVMAFAGPFVLARFCEITITDEQCVCNNNSECAKLSWSQCSRREFIASLGPNCHTHWGALYVA